MKKTILTLACTALATPLVFAQAKNFEGFSLGASVSSTKTVIDTAAASTDGSTTGVNLNAQYNWALGQQYVLGVGIDVGLLKNNAGNIFGKDTSTKNRYALELTPGIALSPDLLVFGKLASLSATIDDGTNTSDITGIGYGIGIRGLADKNTYWQVGYDSNRYFEKSNATGKSTALTLGFGYKF